MKPRRVQPSEPEIMKKENSYTETECNVGEEFPVEKKGKRKKKTKPSKNPAQRKGGKGQVHPTAEKHKGFPSRDTRKVGGRGELETPNKGAWTIVSTLQKQVQTSGWMEKVLQRKEKRWEEARNVLDCNFFADFAGRICSKKK